MNFDGRAVANMILDICEDQDRQITNLSLQKIIYFCHVWSLIEIGKPLIKHSFEAWQYGPVLQYLYREFKDFDRRPISSRATKIDPMSGKREKVDYQFDPVTQELIERVVNFYSRLPAGELVELSHAEGGPWHRVWNHGGMVNAGMKIDNEQIREFYAHVVPPYSLH
ncbi:Panacea domain-containing protein [Insolitispirillum peregrinum]|uniref:Panacea domain-containing protein n=1 Tax=Insolitispirillum peregrinum TaxID=80876 RepID=UPI0009705C93|nr:type II toxin-antitoxin system antitoxin SocA domain-containing protein [Insolitispirillum peregrinum]